MSTNGDVLFEEAEGLRQNAAADGRDDLLEGDFKALWPGVQHLLHYYLVWSFRIFIMYRRNVSARVSQFIPELAFLIIIFNLL